ncbi:NLR family CARD domain-containing protein 3 [Protopterus annectens]|uniref:NLR family CARD domain-containing protein 3 n=1 Tax=Protopterus annectens TaxID=7888 RepID=UPI001CFC2E2A|nr:NLR family CARD domain-containing protein 3 [Protopterus annectens]
MEGNWIHRYRKQLVRAITAPFLENIVIYMKRLDLISPEEENHLKEVTTLPDQVKAVIDILDGKGYIASELLQTFIETTNSQLYLHITVYDPMVQRHFEVLQTRFGNGMELGPIMEKPCLDRLTNLLLIEGLTDIQQREHDIVQIEATKGVRNISKRIPLEKLFLPLSKVSIPPRISVTVGVAGIGKSTLVKLFVYKWAKGDIYRDTTFVLPFSFRELNTFDKLSAEKLIKSSFPHLTEPSFVLSGTAKTILIMDGLDEFKAPLDFSNTLVCTDPKKDIQVENLVTNIIRGNLFSDASVWVTSRPTSASQIPGGLVDRMTEIRGFSELDIKDFVDQVLEERDLSSQVLALIKANRPYYIMCTVPFICSVVSSCIAYLSKTSAGSQDNVVVPKTLSEIYSYFLKVTLKCDWQEKERETPRIDQVSSSCKKTVSNLSRLAFYGLIKKKYVFYEQDLKAYGIDLLSLQSSSCNKLLIKDESHVCIAYYFIHLTLQEYLAASFYYTSAKRAIFDLFTESGMSWPKLGFHNHFKNAIQRSLQSDDGQLDIFVRFLSGFLCPHANKLLYAGPLPKEEQSNYRSQASNFLQSCLNTDFVISSRTVNIMHCLNEIQHTELAKTVEDALKSETLAGKLSPINCSALAYLLQVSDACMEETNLSNCLDYGVFKSLLSQLLYCHNLRLDNNRFKDNVMELLGSLLSAKDCEIQKISLADNKIGNKGAKAVARSLLVNRSLRLLDMRNNCIGPKGAKALSDALKINQGLVSLNLQNNKIGEEGAVYVAEAIQCNRKLTSLHLQKNLIGHEGAKRIAEALKYSSSLLELILASNCVGDVGVTALAEALKVNRTLITLDLQSNSISNKGISALTEALKYNQGLINLNLRENSIGVGGAKAIATALLENVMLQNLDLTANLLHDDGANALSVAVKENQTLSSLHLQWNFISSKAAKALAQALQFNTSLTILDLQENAIGDEGIIALSTALKMNTTLTSLYLQGTSVGINGAKALAEALTVNQKLSVLDLRGNSIGVEGAKALANALRVSRSLKKLNLQENSLGMDGAICIATALTGNHGLMHINLQGNHIGESGAKVISDAIKTKSPNCTVEI